MLPVEEITCPNCHLEAPVPTAKFCPACGTPFPVMVAELEQINVLLASLETLAQRGKGQQTISQVQQELYQRSVTLTARVGRRLPLPPPAPGVPTPETPAPVVPVVTPPLPVPGSSPPHMNGGGTPWFTPSSPATWPSPPVAPVAPSPWPQPAPVGAGPAPGTPPPAPSPQVGPVFDWHRFLSENALTIAGSFAGLLILVGFLFFVFDESFVPLVRFVVICLVYLLFGAAGLSFYNSAALRRKSSVRLQRQNASSTTSDVPIMSYVFLGIFALMTPVVSLAAYLLLLQQVGFSLFGLLCISAFYGSGVYLALSLHIQSSTYAYLGWTSFLLGAATVVFWIKDSLLLLSPVEWLVFATGAAALVMLLPDRLGRPSRVALVATPAKELAGVVTIPVVLGVQALGVQRLQDFSAATLTPLASTSAALMFGAAVLVPLTWTWRFVVRDRKLADPARPQLLGPDILDGATAVFAAEAVLSAALWINPAPAAVAIMLGLLAVAEFAAALVLNQSSPARRELRFFLEGLALTLAGAAVLLALPLPSLWPLVVALTAGGLVLVGLAVMEQAWWLPLGVLVLRIDLYVLTLAFGVELTTSEQITLDFLLAGAFWMSALLGSLRRRAWPFVAPLYLSALGLALYTACLISLETLRVGFGEGFQELSASYNTTILLVFTILAFIAGWRERWYRLGSIFTIAFGVLAPFPLVLNNPAGLDVTYRALVCALAALWLARLRKDPYARVPYIAALWIGSVAVVSTSQPGVDTAALGALGLSFSAWLLVLFTLLAVIAAVSEARPWTMIVPAALGLWAVALTTGTNLLSSAVLDFALLAGGAATRQRKGRWWGSACQFASIVGSALEITGLIRLGPSAALWRIAFLLGFAIAAYFIALQEDQPALTGVAVLYGLLAALFLPDLESPVLTIGFSFVRDSWYAPGPHTQQFLFTVWLTFVAASIGLALRLPALRGRVHYTWALGPYALAIGCSLLALERGIQAAPAWVSLALLGFAIVAYLAAVLEHQSKLTLIGSLYMRLAVYLLPNFPPPLPKEGFDSILIVLDRPTLFQFILTVGLTLAMVAVGVVLRLPLLRSRVRRAWAIVFYLTALGSSFLDLERGVRGAPLWVSLALLIFAAVAYLVAVLERKPLITSLVALYALLAAWYLPDFLPNGQFVLTLLLTFTPALIGAGLRLHALRSPQRRHWTWALYATAIGSSVLALTRVPSFDAGTLELLFLIFAGLAYLLVVLDGESRAGGIPLLYASGAVLAQTNLEALLLLALSLGLLGMLAGRVAQAKWSWPFYAAAGVGTLAVVVRGFTDPGFEALALLLLALLAYVIAAVESRPDTLPLALLLGAMSLAFGVTSFGLPLWGTTLAFIGYSWLVALGRYAWQSIPWLTSRGLPWWADKHNPAHLGWRDPGPVGGWVHRWGGLLVAGISLSLSVSTRDVLLPQNPQPVVASFACWSLAAMLLLLAQHAPFSLARYLAGELGAVGISGIVLFFLGVTTQTFQVLLLAPGTCQLVIGAVLPTDKQVRAPISVAQAFSLIGAAALCLPALIEVIQADQSFASLVYEGVLFVEALSLTFWGLGTRSQPFVIVGFSLVGAATLGGIKLASQYNALPLTIIIIGILLLVLITWYTLRTRRSASSQ